MNKYEVKMLFWEIAKQIEDCSDFQVAKNSGEVLERGMSLSNGCSATFSLDDGAIRIYDSNSHEVMQFKENSIELIALKEVFDLEKEF